MTLLKGNKASQNTQGKGVVFAKTKNQPKDRQVNKKLPVQKSVRKTLNENLTRIRLDRIKFKCL